MATKEKVATTRRLPDDIAKKWYTLEEAMQKTNRSRSFLYRRAGKNGPLKSGNYGGQAIFSRVSVDNFVARYTRG